MAYFNPILQFGVENFCRKCHENGIDGLIIPDLPLEIYLSEYKSIFEKYHLANIFLITPQTSEQRIREIDKNSNSFIYMVSSASVTGSTDGFGDKEMNYFERISNMDLKNPQIIGFGINNKTTFDQATKFQNGAIIGSHFVNFLKNSGSVEKYIGSIISN